ncbi:MAG: hypothetical protein LE168_01520 [Endomicrobium sp.]|nr:hypothetical protein [Endomicrobium sp.]
MPLFIEETKAIATATEGMTKISKKANVKRDALYKAFSRKGNPEAKTYFNVLKTLEFKFIVVMSGSNGF